MIRPQETLATERLHSTNIVILCSICIRLKAQTQQERCREEGELSDVRKEEKKSPEDFRLILSWN